MRYVWLLGLLLVLLGCATSNAGEADAEASDEVARLAQRETPPLEVPVLKVEARGFDLELVSNGKLEARRKAVVPFRVQEQIASVLVKEGQRVKEGQLLGELDAFTYRKRLEEAEHRYQQALIDVEDRLLGYGYRMRDSLIIPEEYMKMARLRSGFNAAQIALEEAQRNLNMTAMKAPISGVVTNLEARVHNPSSAFKQFCELLDVGVMHLVFNLLETELAGVQVGQKVLLTPFAMGGESFNGTVSSINPMVDDKGMVRITAEVPNPGGRLMDGMNARVLLKRRVPDCLVVPKSAVLYRQNRQVVFVYSEGKALWTYVETGQENSGQVVVSDGLEAGMEVIIDNNLNLAHESPVVRRRDD